MTSTNLVDTYVHFANDDRASTVAVTKAFWSELKSGKRTDLESGRLTMLFSFTKDWDSWERHPAGEELVVLVEGEATLVLEKAGGGEEVVALAKPGDFVLVPKDTWHTARTTTKTTMLFVTAGAGTDHRPV